MTDLAHTCLPIDQLKLINYTNIKVYTLLSECIGRHSGLMVSALVPGVNGPGSSPDQGHCVVFLGKTLNPHSASLHPGV